MRVWSPYSPHSSQEVSDEKMSSWKDISETELIIIMLYTLLKIDDIFYKLAKMNK